MTMHKAKGLEADVVFVYGGFGSPSPTTACAAIVDARPARAAWRGSRAGPAHRRPHQARARRRGPAPLLRRADARAQAALPALTRARCPRATRRRSTAGRAGGSPGSSPAATGTSTAACARAADEPDTRRLLDTAEFRIDARPRRRRPARAPAAAALAGLASRSRRRRADVDRRPDARGAAPARRRRGARTSYSRIKQAHGGYRPPTEILDEVAEPPTRSTTTASFPGGARTGIFLHALLEELPLETLREARRRSTRLDARATTSAPLLEAAAPPARPRPRASRGRRAAGPRRADGAAAGRGRPLPGWRTPTRAAREMEFLFPFPAAAGGADRGFVKGFVDVIFEHEGRTYFGDWKTDRLPAWDAATVDAHVARQLRACRSGSTRWRWCACSASTTRPATRPASAARSTSSCAGSAARRRGPQPAPDASTSSRAGSSELADDARRGGDRRDRGTRDAHAWPPAWARDLVPAAPTSTRPRCYLALEAGGWPARSPPPSGAPSRCWCSRSLDSRGDGATRLAARRRSAPRLGAARRRRRRSRAAAAAAGRAARASGARGLRRTPGRLPAVHRRRRLPLSRARPAPRAAPGRRARGARCGRGRSRWGRARAAAGGGNRWTADQAAAIDAARAAASSSPAVPARGRRRSSTASSAPGCPRARAPTGSPIAAPTGKAANRIAELLRRRDTTRPCPARCTGCSALRRRRQAARRRVPPPREPPAPPRGGHRR